MTGIGAFTRRSVIAAPLAACASRSNAVFQGPDEDWTQIERAATVEGAVTIYSTLPESIWRPLGTAFVSAHSGIALRPMRIDSIAGIFERYAQERVAEADTADLLVASSTRDWEPLSRAGQLLRFRPRGLEDIPRWTFAADRYTLSIEPQSFICHRGEPLPTGLHDLARQVAADPSAFAGRIAAYDPFASPFAYSVLQALALRGGDRFWNDLAILAPHMRLQAAAPAMVAGVASGTYRIGIYLPETFVPGGAQTLEVVRPDDGLPVFPRMMAIPREAARPNAARLLVDFLLSAPGQGVLAENGIMAYRQGVARASGRETFETLLSRSGIAPLPVLDDPAIERERGHFDARLRRLLSAAAAPRHGA